MSRITETTHPSDSVPSREPASREVPSRDPREAKELAAREAKNAAKTPAASREIPSTIRDPEAVRTALTGKHVCPFCGATAVVAGEPCPRCTMEDSPATRQATKVRIGPWYVLQTRNPAAPGMKFSTLVALVNKGQVSPRSIVRGPTTHQLWRFAAHVRGLSREFGLCYSCGDRLEKTSAYCPHCERPQEPPSDPDALLEQLNGSTQRPLPRQYGTHEAESRAPETAPSERRAPQNPQGYEVPPQQIIQQQPQQPMQMDPRDYADRGRMSSVQAMIPQGGNPIAIPPRRASRGTLSAMELAAALQNEQATVRPRRSWVLRGIFIVIALGLLTIGMLESIDPSYRKNAVGWSKQQWQTVQAKVDSMRTKSLTQPNARPTRPMPQPAGFEQDPIVQQPTPPPAVKPQPVEQPKPQPVAVVKPKEADPVAPQATSEIKVSPAEKPAEKPKPVQETPKQETPKPQPTPPPAANPAMPSKIEVGAMSQFALQQLARELYYRGLDAEAQDDWSTALESYQKLATLPKEYQYGDLAVRIALAKKQLAK